MIRRLFFGIVLLMGFLLFASLARNEAKAGGYGYSYNSYYVDPGAFTLGHDGYYYWYGSGYPYTRTWVSYSGYGYGGYSGYWLYSRYYPPTTTATYSAPKYTPNWRSDLVGLMKKENDRRSYLDDYAAFQATLSQLGLNNYMNNPSPSYAGGYGNLQLSSAGVQGNTIYGYSTVAQSVSYGNVDLNALLLQYAQSTNNAQQLAGQAHTDLTSVVKLVGSDAARIAEINARANAALALAKATEPQPQTRTETRTFKFQIGPNGQTTITPLVEPNVPTVQGKTELTQEMYDHWQKLSGPQKCYSCHSGNSIKGGFDITKYHPSVASEKDKRRVFNYIAKGDPKTGCPKDSSVLSDEEKMTFLVAPMPASKE